MRNKIINKGDWFMVEIIEKCEPVDSDYSNNLRRVTTWGNFHLIKAASPSEAYDKAVEIGKKGNYSFINSDNLKMKWAFVGIGNILPIYDDIEDGAELIWSDYGFISAKRANKLRKTKRELLKGIKLYKPS